MSRFNKDLGDFGEYVAADFLEAKGYRILEKNYYTHGGELDLIIEDKKFLVFVEVKTRQCTNYGTPAEAVNWKKQQHMLTATRAYLRQNPTQKEIRFDIIEVFALMVGETPRLQSIHHIENAVLEGLN